MSKLITKSLTQFSPLLVVLFKGRLDVHLAGQNCSNASFEVPDLQILCGSVEVVNLFWGLVFQSLSQLLHVDGLVQVVVLDLGNLGEVVVSDLTQVQDLSPCCFVDCADLELKLLNINVRALWRLFSKEHRLP